MIVHCRYHFISPDGTQVGWSDTYSPALFTLHSELNHVILEIAHIGGSDRVIRILEWTAPYYCGMK